MAQADVALAMNKNPSPRFAVIARDRRQRGNSRGPSVTGCRGLSGLAMAESVSMAVTYPPPRRWVCWSNRAGQGWSPAVPPAPPHPLPLLLPGGEGDAAVEDLGEIGTGGRSR